MECSTGTTAASAQLGQVTSADSTSAVPMRWPLTLITAGSAGPDSAAGTAAATDYQQAADKWDKAQTLWQGVDADSSFLAHRWQPALCKIKASHHMGRLHEQTAWTKQIAHRRRHVPSASSSRPCPSGSHHLQAGVLSVSGVVFGVVELMHSAKSSGGGSSAQTANTSQRAALFWPTA